MKRILFISAFPPNSKTAGQNYTKSLLADLVKDYSVDLIYWSYPGHDIEVPHAVNVIREETINSNLKTILFSILLFLFPFYVVRFSWKTDKFIRKIAKDYDVLYFDFSQVFVYSRSISHPCVVKMYHDVISQKYSRALCSKVYKWLVNYSERKLSNKSDLSLTFSSKDEKLLADQYGLKSEVVPFYISDDASKVQIKEVRNITFAFYGAWNRPENYKGLIWFFDNVYPLTLDKKYVIIGGGMSAELKNRLCQTPNVECTGFVDNPFTIISSCQALIAPIFKGAGVKVKVIESLATGTPVIGTNVAFEGIENIEVDGLKALNLVKTAEEFADTVNRFACSVSFKRLIQQTFLSKYADNKAIDVINTYANLLDTRS